ncbi:MAG TPA: hypothetical protein ENN22_02385 [bacterium]|nr:hypothetical protein [bacterium]
MANTDNQLFINSQIKRTAKDSLIYLPAMVIPAITGILLIRVFTTIFSPQEYGHYQVTLSTFGLIRVFSMVWLATSVTRFFLKYKLDGSTGLFFSTLFICGLFSAIGMAGFSFGVNFFIFKSKLSPALFSLINLAIAASIFSTIFEILVMIFRAGLEPKKYSLFWILFSVGKPVVGIALILLFNFRVSAIFWGFLIVPLALDLILFFKLDLINQVRIRNFSKPLFSQIARYGVPFTFSLFAFWVLSLSDRYLIEFFRGSAEVGYYSVGYIISEKMLNFIYTILMLAAYPIIVDNWEKYGDRESQRLITELSRYYFIICTPILALLVVIPEQMLKIFSSAKFVAGARVLPLIAIGVFLNGVCQYVLKGFELHKRSLNVAKLALIAGIINVGLNIILIPRFGYIGAGISMASAYTVYFMLSVYLVRAEMAWIPPYRSIFNNLISAIILTSFLMISTKFIDHQLLIIFLIIPIGILIYYFSLLALNEIKKQEIDQGLKFIHKLFKV